MDTTNQKIHQQIENIINRPTARKRFGIMALLIWIVLIIRGYFVGQIIFNDPQTQESYQKIEQGIVSIQSQLSGILPASYTLTISNTGLQSSYNPIIIRLPQSFGQTYSGQNTPENFLVIDTRLSKSTSGNQEALSGNVKQAYDTSILVTRDELLFHTGFVDAAGYSSQWQFSSLETPVTITRQEIILALQSIISGMKTGHDWIINNPTMLQIGRIIVSLIIALGYALIIVITLRGIKVIISAILSLTSFPITSSIPRDKFLHNIVFFSYLPLFLLMRFVSIGTGHQGGLLIMIIAIVLLIYTFIMKNTKKPE